MHLRGRDFRFEALYPNGRTETLLEVPRFDFNWQYDYRLLEPKPMPRGTRICCTAHYDNSPANPVNPDPAAIVRWGDQTWQEMMIGYLHITRPKAARAADIQGGSLGMGAAGLVALLAVLGAALGALFLHCYRSANRAARVAREAAARG
jgi:hypothetical protein